MVFDVESGNTVADALRKHPKAFTDLYVNMVAAGEAGGILDTILMRLATFLEKNDALVRKVKGAMIYPAVIMSVAAIAIVVLLDLRHPGVREHVRVASDMALPLPTRIVIGAVALPQAATGGSSARRSSSASATRSRSTTRRRTASSRSTA